MIIKLICRRYIPGEAWTNRVLAYARGFAELGVNVKLCYLISDKKRSKYEINIPGVEVINLWEEDGFLGKHNRYISLFRNLFRLKHYIQPSDSVFIYGAESYLVKTALLKTDNVYVEITEHPFMRGSVENVQLSFTKKKLLKRVKGLFVISKSLKSYFIQNGVEESKIHISNMFVDTNRFNIIKQETSEKYFAYCGVVSIYKDGVNTLLKAFSEFVQKYPDYKLYIIGRFESPLVQEELFRLTASLRISESVIYTGPVEPTKMPELLINSQALVLARPNNLQSKYGFPTKLGEYLATGNPVIITDVGEIGDFIKSSENGIVVPPDNPQLFSESMKWVVEHPQEGKMIGMSGKLLANNEFSYKTQCRKVFDIIINSSKIDKHD